jgi:hypothetical protein
VRIIEPLLLAKGDHLHLTRSDEPGRPATCDFNGQVIEPARIPCTLKEVFGAVKPDEQVWFDDGKIGGVVLSNDGRVIAVEITHTGVKGGRLRPEKGINFPVTKLDIPALTEKDLEDRRTVVAYADLIGLSFVRTPADVESLHGHLARLDAKHIGVILKIETNQGFENLPQLLLTSLCLNRYIRFRWALTEDEPLIKAYDEKAWATLPDASRAAPEVSLALLDALHARRALLLRALTPEQCQRKLRHPEAGLLKLETMLGLYDWHGRHHLRHITGLRQRQGW